MCESGGARRTWLRGLEKVAKRYKLVVAAHNLSLLMRRLFGIGKPRCLQGASAAFSHADRLAQTLRKPLRHAWEAIAALRCPNAASQSGHHHYAAAV